jgi:hypothetical protein
MDSWVLVPCSLRVVAWYWLKRSDCDGGMTAAISEAE